MEKYKIKSFSKHMGVSLDTIKHYQQCGILTPEIDPNNNYRYYTVRHGERLIVSRRFRNLGFSLEDTKELISSKNGEEIMEMLRNRKQQIEAEIKQLEKKSAQLTHHIDLCDIFLTKAGTFVRCDRPGYYIHRHTHEMDFMKESSKEELTKILMNELPTTCKLLMIPHDSLEKRVNENFHHTIAIPENASVILKTLDLSQLEYHPSIPAVKYIYSRPYTTDKAVVFDDIRQELIKKGYSIANNDIFIENGVDFYLDNVRFENYLIYFPLNISE